ncbi:NAD-dependent epimerase/dehydratase family protein [Pseudidiomarina donghaiensis]|uniref:NAD-dependent epimerase/dehydratase family protein n=1 Tax=Pseudidiomarina donghaiensis TaxID=519452 RepID=UPI003A978004
MDRYLITGSSGFVGRHLISCCTSKGISFLVLKRSDSLQDENLFSENLSTVIHLAGRAHVLNEQSESPYHEFYEANCVYALNVAKAAAKNGLKRFVYVSSIGVYGKSSSTNLISENSPLEPVEDYARSKFEAERELTKLSKELGFELVIVRPALVYGYDAPGNIERLLKLTFKLPIVPIAEKKNKRSFVYVENLVDFLLLVATHPSAAGNAFNIADDVISTHNLIENFAKGMGRNPILFSFPRFIWKVLLKLVGKQKMYEQLFEDLVLDMSFAKKELGWQPKYNIVSGLQDTGRQFTQANTKTVKTIS